MIAIPFESLDIVLQGASYRDLREALRCFDFGRGLPRLVHRDSAFLLTGTLLAFCSESICGFLYAKPEGRTPLVLLPVPVLASLLYYSIRAVNPRSGPSVYDHAARGLTFDYAMTALLASLFLFVAIVISGMAAYYACEQAKSARRQAEITEQQASLADQDRADRQKPERESAEWVEKNNEAVSLVLRMFSDMGVHR